MLRGDAVCITGDNGSGKMTLLDGIFDQVQGVQIPPSDEIGYFRQNYLDVGGNQAVLERIMEKNKCPESYRRMIMAASGIRGEAGRFVTFGSSRDRQAYKYTVERP